MQTGRWKDRDLVPQVKAVRMPGGDSLAGPGASDDIAGEWIEPFWMMDGSAEADARIQSRFKVGYNDQGLGFLIVCDEPVMSNVRAEAAEENGLIAEDDNVEIFIDPAGQGEFLYHFGFNMRGVRMQRRSDLGSAWREPWQVLVDEQQRAWVSRVFIPWTTFDIDDRVGSEWRINVVRTRQSDGAAMMSWSPTFSHNAYTTPRFGKVSGLHVDFGQFVSCGQFQIVDFHMDEINDDWTFRYDIEYRGSQADGTDFSVDDRELCVLKAAAVAKKVHCGGESVRLQLELSAAKTDMDAQGEKSHETVRLLAQSPSGRSARMSITRMLRFTDIRGFLKPDHPGMFLTAEQIDDLKDRAANDPWTRKALDKIYRQADQLVADGFTLPEHIGAWNAYYFCPKHAARLDWDRNSPHGHRCPVDGETLTGDVYDAAWRALYHERLFPQVRIAGVAYLASNNIKYARIVREIILAYARQYNEYPIWGQGGLGDISGARVTSETIHEVGFLECVMTAYDFTMASGLYNDEDRRVIEQFLFPEVVKVIRRFNTCRTNWQVRNNFGVLLAAAWRGDRVVLDEMLNGPMGFHFHMSQCVLPGGFWYEGSPGYHGGVADTLLLE